MKKLHLGLIACLISTVFVLYSCEYEFVEPEELPDVVSFQSDLVPYFTGSCLGSSCHSSGAIAPDLTAANAYNAIISGNFVNTTTPGNSELYKKLATGSMQSFATPAQAALVLKWIEQGAQNN